MNQQNKLTISNVKRKLKYRGERSDLFNTK